MAEPTFNELDMTFTPRREAGMILALIGKARRGPTAEADGEPPTLASDTDVDKYLGAGSATYLAPGIAKYVIGRGGVVKFVRAIRTGSKATYMLLSAGLASVIRVDALNPGTAGNLMAVTVAADPSGSADLFALTVAFSEQPGLGNTYYNLSMDSTKANYVENVINDVSPIVKVTVIAATRPANGGPFALTGGLVNDSATAADYEAALVLFNSERFITHLAADTGDGEVWSKVAAYAQTRATMFNIHSVPYGYTSALASLFRQGSGGYGFEFMDNSYTGLYWGDPKTKRNGSVMPVPEWCHPLVLGQYALKMGTSFPWFAVAGGKRGVISAGYGVTENVLGKAAQTSFEENEINGIVVDYDPDLRKKVTMIAESMTCQRARTQRRFAEVREGLNWIKRRFLYHQRAIGFDPNEPEAWRDLYGRMKIDLDYMGGNRGLDGVEGYGWQYVGDQNCIRKQDATYNSQDDLGEGKYKAAIYCVTVPAIRRIELTVVLTKTSASFAETGA